MGRVRGERRRGGIGKGSEDDSTKNQGIVEVEPSTLSILPPLPLPPSFYPFPLHPLPSIPFHPPSPSILLPPPFSLHPSLRILKFLEKPQPHETTSRSASPVFYCFRQETLSRVTSYTQQHLDTSGRAFGRFMVRLVLGLV